MTMLLVYIIRTKFQLMSFVIKYMLSYIIRMAQMKPS